MGARTDFEPQTDPRQDEAAAAEERAPAPFLPASFYSKLVHQPSCITKGVCNNCGRCEH